MRQVYCRLKDKELRYNTGLLKYLLHLWVTFEIYLLVICIKEGGGGGVEYAKASCLSLKYDPTAVRPRWKTSKGVSRCQLIHILKIEVATISLGMAWGTNSSSGCEQATLQTGEWLKRTSNIEFLINTKREQALINFKMSVMCLKLCFKIVNHASIL